MRAKNTKLNGSFQALTSLLESGSLTDIPGRRWSCITIRFDDGQY